LADIEPQIAFIVAVAENGVIGRDGGLPWRLSSDLKLFRRLTMGKPVVMGRATWQSLYKQPLDGRDNIVVSRDANFEAPGAHVAADVNSALEAARVFAQARGVDEIMVIGGAAIYRSMWDKANRIYWTQVHGAPDGDITLEPLDLGEWREMSREEIVPGPRDTFEATLVVFERIS